MSKFLGIRLSVATSSLGKTAAGYHIRQKLRAARAQGFDGVEVAFDCLEGHALLEPFASEDSRASRLLAAAQDIYTLASAESLEIIALTPFGAYDALEHPDDVQDRLQEAELWLQICEKLRAPILQVPTFIPPTNKKTTSNINKIADNMRRLGQLARSYNKIIAYEGVAWGIYTDKWQQIRDIIELVNLPNVRHCLDTFHIAACLAGDPFNASAPVRPEGLIELGKSLEELRQTLDPNTIGYFQLSDATVADPDQRGYANPDLSQPPFMVQSRNCRIYPCEPEHGGALPAVDVAKAVFDTGYRGWVSMEVFHTDLWKYGEE
ncbi:unnamed protein product [Clonostachys rhizophaga]|uniref:Xylose isomerase-like TIM barrel domain-containing protein n=1 Tax=Clonostachys rhizophaga TaxID=160324 RepID=A0A9N9VAL4_9HYPO|nr:unnamed protein product [Clonostachys rhizophaga]